MRTKCHHEQTTKPSITMINNASIKKENSDQPSTLLKNGALGRLLIQRKHDKIASLKK